MGIEPRAPLRRNMRDRQIGGVCAGLADHFGWDRNLVRVLWVIAIIMGIGSPILIYVLMWIFIPEGEY